MDLVSATNQDEMPEINPQDEVTRLQQAIEGGDVPMARKWASELAKRNLRLSIDIHKDEKEEEDIHAVIHIENKEISVGCVQWDLKPSLTVSTLKLMMLQIHGFPPDIQKWIIGQQVVSDDMTLAQCGVKSSGASLFLYLVSAQSVGLTKEGFKTKYSHLVRPGIPGLPRSLSQTSSVSTEGNRTLGPVTPTSGDPRSVFEYSLKRGSPSTLPANFKLTEIGDMSLYMYTHVPAPVIDEGNEAIPPPPSTDRSSEEDHHQVPVVPTPTRPLTEEEKKEKFGWTCTRCTLQNWPTWPGCEICDAERPDDYVRPGDYVLSPREQKRMDKEAVSEAAAVEQEDNERTFNYCTMLAAEEQDLIPNPSPFDCPVCFVPVEPGEGVTLRECLHVCCKDCLKNYVNISNDAVIKCPYQNDEYSCDAVIQDREIKALVTHHDFQNYLQRGLHLAENQAPNSYHCKTTDCAGWCFYDDNNNFFNCPVCFEKNCLTCKAIHQNMNCKEYQEEIKRKAINDQSAQRTQKMLQDLLDKGEALKCPRCDVIVMKKDGCDWICCSMCRLEICWVTKGPRWGPNGAGDSSGGCRCRENGKPCHPKCQNCH